jgi:hypothetical protein
MIGGNTGKTIEQDIAEFFAEHGRLPKFIFAKLEDGVYTHQDKIEHILATRLQAFFRTGKININDLPNKVLHEIDRSKFYQNMMRDYVVTAESLKNYARGYSEDTVDAADLELFRLSASINKKNISKLSDFSGVAVLEQMAKRGLTNSQKIDREMTRVLDTRGNSFLKNFQSLFQ